MSMRRFWIAALAATFALGIGGADAASKSGSSHSSLSRSSSHSTAPKKHYANEGGHYANGKGSSHKGGHYVNPRTKNHYTKHPQ
jgi:hypothetical protein